MLGFWESVHPPVEGTNAAGTVISLLFLPSLKIKWIGVTLVDKTIQASSVPLNKTSRAHCIVGPSPKPSSCPASDMDVTSHGGSRLVTMRQRSRDSETPPDVIIQPPHAIVAYFEMPRFY